MPDLLEEVRKDHEFWHAAYKAMGNEELFFYKFWDGYDNFDDYFKFGDTFPKLSFERPKTGLSKTTDAEHGEIRKEVIEQYKNSW